MAFANIWQWLKTAASNSSLNGIALGENVMLPSGVNNAFREFMSQIATVESKGTDVASATTLALGTERYYHVTGTTTITDIDFTDAVDGRWAWLIFDGALTLTHNATTLKLPGGANITTAAGDRALFVQDATDNVICLAYVRATTAPDPLPTSGFRNKIINGDFDVWQRGVSVVPVSGVKYTADRWAINYDGTGASHSVSRQAFAPGQTDVPGSPGYYCRIAATVAGSGGAFKQFRQPIEGVRTLAGRQVTVTFYAKANVATTLFAFLQQAFGSGGAPSAIVSVSIGAVNLTTAWQKFSFLATVPSIAGKTLGANGDDLLYVTLASLPVNATFAIDISHVSLVDGDATAEADPFSPRHIQQETALCQRYYCDVTAPSAATASYGFGYLNNSASCRVRVPIPVPMRTTPTINATSAEIRSNGTSFTPSAYSVTGQAGTQGGPGIDLDVTIAAGTQNQPVILSGTTSNPLTFDAEL